MITVNAERALMWVEALRSGDYTQVRGAFRGGVNLDDGDGTVRPGYCCLAVATDVAIKNGLDNVRWHVDNDAELEPIVQIRFDPEVHEHIEDYDHDFDADGVGWINYDDGDMPLPVAQWLGVKDVGGTAITNPNLGGITAISRNDDHSQSFGEIADAIEADIVRIESSS